MNLTMIDETPQPNKIYNMDCLSYLDKLCEQEKQIDTIILNPPYFNVVNEKWDRQW